MIFITGLNDESVWDIISNHAHLYFSIIVEIVEKSFVENVQQNPPLFLNLESRRKSECVIHALTS